MNLYKATIALYETLFRQATMNTQFTYIPVKRDALLILEFTKWLKANTHPMQLSEYYVQRFIEFQFSRYAGKVNAKGKNIIPIHWLIGPKAQAAWQVRDIREHGLAYYKIRKNGVINLSKAFEKENRQEQVNRYLTTLSQVPKHEEAFKKRYHNKKEGLVWCAGNTTLHHPESISCKNCNFADECKKLQQTNYPKIYSLRHG